MSHHDPLFGRMNDPIGSACVRGPCGDTMEFYLVIHSDRIEDVRYYTEGCDTTRACGAAAAGFVAGVTVAEAMDLSAAQVLKLAACDPAEGRHCAILAVTTLYRALADYLLKP